MTWLGLIGGIVLGGLIWGWPGAFTLGFLGWLGGFIIGSARKSAKPVEAPVQVESTAQRLSRLERSVASLETRLARLEGEPIVEQRR